MKFVRPTSDRHGFTLIELMVVVAIIGSLSSVILGATANSRAKSFDARKRAEMRSISTALYLYRDTYGTNPINRTPGVGYADTQPNFLQELVTAGIYATNPKSPNSPTLPYYYYDYGPGNSIGMLLVTTLYSAPPTTGYSGSCRPWTAGTNWCDQSATPYHCICNPY